MILKIFFHHAREHLGSNFRVSELPAPDSVVRTGISDLVDSCGCTSSSWGCYFCLSAMSWSVGYHPASSQSSFSSMFCFHELENTRTQCTGKQLTDWISMFLLRVFRVKMMDGAAPHNQIDAEVAAGMGRPDNGPRLQVEDPAMTLWTMTWILWFKEVPR